MPTDVAKLVRTDSGLSSALRMSVMRLARRLRAERDPSLDLSLNQLSVLGILYRQGSLTVGELAALERVQPPSMTRTVHCLAEIGLVERRRNAADGRQVVVALADAGRRLVAEDRIRRDAWLVRRLRALTPEERDALRAAAPILERLAQE
jgi:DNA-binding MarR family transcriptional regulator